METDYDSEPSLKLTPLEVVLAVALEKCLLKDSHACLPQGGVPVHAPQ